KSQGRLRTLGAGTAASGTIFVDASGSSVTLNAGDTITSTLQVGGAGSNTYTGGTGAKTVVNGLGTITILAANNDYAGDWQIDSGTLRPIGGASLGSGTSPLVVNSTGTLLLNPVGISRPINLNGTGTLALGLGSQSFGTHTIAP